MKKTLIILLILLFPMVCISETLRSIKYRRLADIKKYWLKEVNPTRTEDWYKDGVVNNMDFAAFANDPNTDTSDPNFWLPYFDRLRSEMDPNYVEMFYDRYGVDIVPIGWFEWEVFWETQTSTIFD